MPRYSPPRVQGTVLDLSSVQTFNAGWNDSDGNTYVTTCRCRRRRGVVDLSGVRVADAGPRRRSDRFCGECRRADQTGQLAADQRRGPRILQYRHRGDLHFAGADNGLGDGRGCCGQRRLVVAGGDIPGVGLGRDRPGEPPRIGREFIGRRTGWLRLATGASLNAAQLTSLQWFNVQFNGQGATLDAPKLDRLNFSVLKLRTNGTFTSSAMTNIDNSMIYVSGRHKFGVSTGNLWRGEENVRSDGFPLWQCNALFRRRRRKRAGLVFDTDVQCRVGRLGRQHVRYDRPGEQQRSGRSLRRADALHAGSR